MKSEVGVRYMVCLDTLESKFYVINGSIIKTFAYNRTNNPKYSAYFIQGAGYANDTAFGYFSEKHFLNDMPPSFFAMTDPRSKEVFTYSCSPYLKHTLKLIVFIFITKES